MSELRSHFERLMEFARRRDFHKPFSQVVFVEERNIRPYSAPDQTYEISRSDMFDFPDYENRFTEIPKAGHSWINLNFAGVIDDILLIVVEFPNYENQCDSPTINLSLPEKRIVENDWSASAFIKII